jgi:hypothetical protein
MLLMISTPDPTTNPNNKNMSTPTTTTAPKFILVGRDSDWNTAFAVEEGAANYVVKLLNREDGDDWIGITVPMVAEEIEATRADWRKNGMIA